MFTRVDLRERTTCSIPHVQHFFQRSCTLDYTADKEKGFYVVALQVEDFASPIARRPFSSIPVQFLVHVTEGTGNCDAIPELVEPSEECFVLEADDTLHVTLTARSQQG